MSSLSRFELLLHEAVADPRGLVVQVDGDRELARQKFYQARSRSLHLFEEISIVISPMVSNELWLLNKGGPGAEDQ